MSAYAAARFVKTLDKYVDVKVTFMNFANTGATRYNQPHAEYLKNGASVTEEQVLFNGSLYGSDVVRVPAVTGDRIEVVVWWATNETRDGQSLPRTTIETFFF